MENEENNKSDFANKIFNRQHVLILGGLNSGISLCFAFHLQARRALGDFGLFIAIILMVLFDHFLADTFTQVRKYD